MKGPVFCLSNTLTGHRAAVYAVVSGLAEGSFLTAGGDGWVVSWDAQNPDPGRVVAMVEGQVFALGCHVPSGQYLAGTMLGDLHWFEEGRSSRNSGLRHHPGGVYGILVTERKIWTAGGDGRVTLWDPASRSPLHSVQIARKAVRRLAYHEGSGLLAAATSDGDICILDAETLALVKRIGGAHLPSVFCVAFGADGRTLWSGGRDARIRKWDLEDLQEMQAIQGHWYTVNALCMDPKRAFLFSASRDRTIRVWDADSCELLQGLETVRDGGHRNSVNDLLLLPDIGILISVSDDRTVSMWTASQPMG